MCECVCELMRRPYDAHGQTVGTLAEVATVSVGLSPHAKLSSIPWHGYVSGRPPPAPTVRNQSDLFHQSMDAVYSCLTDSGSAHQSRYARYVT